MIPAQEPLIVDLFAGGGGASMGCDLRAAKTKAGKVKLIGNSVCPEVEEALADAQLPIGPALPFARAA